MNLLRYLLPVLFLLLAGCASQVTQIEADPTQRLDAIMRSHNIDYLWQLDCQQNVNCDQIAYQLEGLVNDRPDATVAKLMLMAVQLQRGRTNDFFIVTNKFLQQQPQASITAWELAALAAYRIGDFKRVKVYVRSGRQYFPNSAWLPFILAGAYFQEGNYEGANQAMIDARVRGLPRGQELYGRALVAQAQQDLAVACDLFEQALSTDPRNPTYRAKLISLYSDKSCELQR